MSKSIDDLISLLPNARRERVANNVFDITVVIVEANSLKAAIETLRIFGGDAIAYHINDTFDDVRIRVTFRSGDVEPLIHYNKLRAAS